MYLGAFNRVCSGYSELQLGAFSKFCQPARVHENFETTGNKTEREQKAWGSLSSVIMSDVWFNAVLYGETNNK
jgi:hypothetical protein